MNVPLCLTAIDESDTKVREDGFSVQTSLGGSVTTLTVASSIPPLWNEISTNKRKWFLKELYRGKYSDNESDSYLTKEQKSQYGLDTTTPKPALCAVYTISEVQDGICELSESLQIQNVLIEPHTYKGYQKGWQALMDMRYAESFFQAYPDIRVRNHRRITNENRAHVLEPSKLFVFKLTSMFNMTCSEFALSKEIPTLRIDEIDTLRYGIQNRANFTAPLRKPRSYHNITNLLDALHRRPLTFTWSTLRDLGIKFRMV